MTAASDWPRLFLHPRCFCLAYHIAGKFGEFFCFEHLVKKLARLLIVATNLDGFSLANHGGFFKFVNLFHYTVY